MPVFHLPKKLAIGEKFSISARDYRHLKASLRTKPGQSFKILFPDGTRARATLHKQNHKWIGEIESLEKGIPQKTIPVWVGIGAIRRSRLEWYLEKATELGVQRVSPLLLQYSRLQIKEKLSKTNRLKTIIKETLKQCERPAGPQLDSFLNLEAWLEKLEKELDPTWSRILFNEKVDQPRWPPEDPSAPSGYCLLVGPEGGFTKEEIQLAESHSFKSFSLGQARLKTETAALYGTISAELIIRIRENP